MSDLALRALAIYYQHYGKKNNELRKRQYALNKLKNTIDKHCDVLKNNINASLENIDTSIDDATKIQLLKNMRHCFLPKEYDDSYFSYHRLKICYRNHIYPAEIYTYGSLYHWANVRYIDGILIDRNADAEEHIRVRGKYKFLNKFV